MSRDDFDEVVKEYNLAMSDFFKGNPDPINKIFSSHDDISLAQLSGSFVRGRKLVTETASFNATKYREGAETRFELLAKFVSPELAYIVQIEHVKAKIGGSDEISSLALRVTSIFRREEGAWKLLHRHADPLTSMQPTKSIMQK